MGLSDLIQLHQRKHRNQWKEKTIDNIQLEGEIVWQRIVEAYGI